jgi:hypothetical protein
MLPVVLADFPFGFSFTLISQTVANQVAPAGI